MSLQGRNKLEFGEVVEKILDDWEETRESGIELNIPSVCNHQPEVIQEVRRRIQAVIAVEGRLGTVPFHDQTARDDSTPSKGPVELALKTSRLEFLAAGGLGAVYLANDAQVNRRLAIKFAKRGAGNALELRERFLGEARITGTLDHPGVVPMYGIGEDENGTQFYVMRYVRGTDLGTAIDEFYKAHGDSPRFYDTMEFRDLLGRIISVCNTLAYAHQHGVLHRDIKPQNILLGKFGETYIADWGLAIYRTQEKPVDHEGSVLPIDTLFREMLPTSFSEGTPAYMSPEQHMGVESLNFASDIYSLGVVLFRLITGKLPVDAADALQLQQRVIDGDLTAPVDANARCPVGLARVCKKAMELEPEDRYERASDIARDLEAYLGGFASSVYREPWHRTVSRFLQRHRFLAYSIVLASIGIGFAIVWAVISNVEEQEAQRTISDLERQLELEQAGVLESTAQSTAMAMGDEIESRWRVMRLVARDRQLIALLDAPPTPPVKAQDVVALEASLGRLTRGMDVGLPSHSWSILDRRGYQVARVAMDDNRQVGANYAHRSYFHGRIDEKSTSEIQEKLTAELLPDIIDQPAFFAADVSSLEGQEVITFSVPIRDGDRVLGVLAANVLLGQFEGIGSIERNRRQHYPQSMMLIQQRKLVEGVRTVVLQHSAYQQGAGESAKLSSIEMESTLQEQIYTAKNDALNSAKRGAWPVFQLKAATDIFVDDDVESPAMWKIWGASVLVTSRNAEQIDTGLVVIIGAPRSSTADASPVH